MWWCRRILRPASAATALVVALLLSGCGFQPLYGRNSAGNVESEFRNVKIETISGRVGQRLHNYLLDRINREGRPANPLYLLSVDLDVQQVRLGFERDDTATRGKVVVLADVRLHDIATGEVLLNRSARSTTSYNIVDSAVVTRSAELDAIDRAAREVSDEIRLMLSLYFRRRAGQAESS